MNQLESVDSPLQDSDVRAMVRLIGEVAALPGGLTEKKKALMEGLCRLIDADFWQWALSAAITVEGERPADMLLHDGYAPGQLARHMRVYENHELAAIQHRYFLDFGAYGTHVTRHEEQLDTVGELRSGEVGRLFHEADVGTQIISFRPHGNDAHSCIGFFRRVGRPKFDARETRIAHIVLTEVPWLHAPDRQGERVAKGPVLSPRLRTITRLLLEGMGRKEIAADTRLSEDTVNGYVKQIYKIFQVNSQAKLLRKFADGDGGERA